MSPLQIYRADGTPKTTVPGSLSVPIEAWHIVGAAGEPAPQNGWVNYGSGYPNAAFRKDPLGHVTLRGVIKTGTIAQPAFVLPVGYRPPANALISTISNNAAGQLFIDATNGQVIPNSGSNIWFTLDGVEFDTDTVAQMPTGPQGPPGPIGLTGGNATVPMDSWHTVGAAGEPAFTNGWVNYGSSYQVLQFRKDPLGKVQIRGAIKNGTINTNAFTLPAGYLPPSLVQFTLSRSIGTDVAVAEVAPNGNVAIYRANDYCDLSVVEFDTDLVTAMPTGPQGPQGIPGTQISTYAQSRFGSTYPTVACGAGVYSPLLPFTSVAADIEISRSDGTNPDFERMSDGSLRVVNAGFYDYSVTAGFGPSGVSAGQYNIYLAANQAGATPTTSDVFANVSEQIAHNFPIIGISRGVYLAANARVGAFVYCAVAAGTCSIYTFSIARSGGPQGPAGPAGPEAYLQVSRSADQPIANIAETTVTYNTVGVTRGATAPTLNPSTGVVTIQEAGEYTITAYGYFADNASTQRRILALFAGGNRVARETPVTNGPSNNNPGATLNATVYLAVGATVYATVYHEVGAALNWMSPYMTVTKVGPGPQGPQGVPGARMWRATDSTLRSTAVTSYGEISTSLRVTPTPTTGTLLELMFAGQWEHNTLGQYIAVQLYDLDAAAYLPGIYWTARARAASENVSFTFMAVLAANLVPSGHRITLYWSTGAGTCYLRADTTPAYFAIKEYAVG